MEEAGSFRDRTSRVFYQNGHVYRALNEDSLQNFRAIANLPFFKNALKSGAIVNTEEVALSNVQIPSAIANTNQGESKETYWAGALKHERIPFVSYPYEWCFGMLKDAALLHLDLLLNALEHDFIPKDSSAYNIQFAGAKPVFIDIGSFEALKAGEPWVGYRQFCQLFLYPLMLQAYKAVPFQTWLRASLDGIEVNDMNGLMSFRDIFRPGVFKHVVLHSKLQNLHSASKSNVRNELQELGFSKELIKANVTNIRKLIEGLCLPVTKSVWVGYASDNSYSDKDAIAKKEFIANVVLQRRRSMVWDMGCNTGVFSNIAAQNSDYVVAMDYDHQTIENLYKDLKAEKRQNILPITMNLAAPSPNHGWRGKERKDLASRGKPDLIFALALIHHMVIASNIPLREFVSWLASLCSELVIEFVTREDPMVKTLLANKEDIYHDYNQPNFERCLEEHFTIVKKQRLASDTRELYYCSLKK